MNYHLCQFDNLWRVWATDKDAHLFFIADFGKEQDAREYIVFKVKQQEEELAR